ncbi:hypothetical protein HN358_00435 [Candidatus Uhrbacteria bacterium]|nr:hypothetical protein [Candidatus Uhrbacteria bacterium]
MIAFAGFAVFFGLLATVSMTVHVCKIYELRRLGSVRNMLRDSYNMIPEHKKWFLTHGARVDSWKDRAKVSFIVCAIGAIGFACLYRYSLTF